MAEIKLLLVEDNLDFSQVVKDSLELMGDYDVYVAPNGVMGYEAYKSFMPDLIISDVEMPQMSGLEMVERIRREDKMIPIIFASAKTEPKDLAKGFRLDIDDYIKKPYLPAELHLHIRAILRRVGSLRKENQKNTIFRIGGYLFNSEVHILVWKDEKIELTFRESQILEMLCEQKGNVVKRENILQRFWGTDDFYTSRSLDVFISKLRKILAEDTSIQIQTVRGEGLRMIF